MPNVFDVAKYILEKKGSMTTWKLQKLVYYCQVWSVVWDEEPIFDQSIEAWANGPVVRELFNIHQGEFKVNVSNVPRGKSENLKQNHKETIDAVLRDYGDFTSQYLSDLTHMEAPWREARGSTPEGASSDSVISLESMLRYYGSLVKE